MNQKICNLVAILFFFTTAIKAQPAPHDLPAGTIVKSYKLEIGYYTTTVLVFRTPVKVGDRGFNEIIAQKQPDVANVLKIKAARKDFTPTNLHAFTTDGKVYTFDIIYNDHPANTTFNLADLDSMDRQPINDCIQFSGMTLNDDQLDSMVALTRKNRAFFGRASRQQKMKLQLQSIYTDGNLLFFSFVIRNKSNLNYDIDFIKLYIQGRQQAKRSSLQEKEILPVYRESLQTVEGNNRNEFVVVVPKFTLPDNGNFIIEMHEKNGGRNISLEIKNRHLLKTRPFSQDIQTP